MTINQTPITPASLIIFALIILAAIFVTRIFTRLVFDRILKKIPSQRRGPLHPFPQRDLHVRSHTPLPLTKESLGSDYRKRRVFIALARGK